MNEPLAIMMRPNKLSDVIGQKHLLGENKVLYNLIKNKKLFSMILYGKPGIGKTTIALMIVNELGLRYRMLNAVINNKKDFEAVFNEAKMYDNMVLIVDEIHRLNKDKQDLLLPCLESGLITLIGLTTSNPYHVINPAIRSRCTLLKLEPLSKDDIKEAIKRAILTDDLKDIKLDDDVIDYIASIAKYDLRFAFNILEISYYFNDDHTVTLDVIKNINPQTVIEVSKDGDDYYDLLSGLQKSIRGSDVNAALHYLARLLEAGDIESIVRRLSVIVYEDIGLADPFLGVKIDACINSALRIGLPEAMIPLSNAVIEMSLSPKSNTAYLAIDSAINDLKLNNLGNIPACIKAPYIGYLYPHNYKGSIVNQQYMPENIKNSKYFNPKETSKHEIMLKNTYLKIEEYKKNIGNK